MNIEDTKACVRSIESKCVSPYSIIVDNGSSNNSGIELTKYYANSTSVEVITNKENLGFARGMNIGYKLAKVKGADTICLVNSDIELVSKNFDIECTRLYKDHSFYVCGPNIHTLSGRKQNPAGYAFDTYSELKKIIFQHTIYFYLTYLNLDLVLPKLKKRVFGRSSNQIFRESITRTTSSSQVNVKLHGAFLILSKDFISFYEGLNESTFLYGEEDILHYTLRKNEHKTLYSTEIEVLHKEDGSLNSVISSKIKKRRFIYKHQVHSYKVFKNLIEKDNNEQLSLSNM